jgi:hypothetical protein
LNVDDQLRFAELVEQTGVLTAQAFEFLVLRVALRLGAAPLGRQSRDHAGVAFAPPADQMRGIKPFAAQQGSYAARGGLGRFGLGQNAELVLGAKVTALGVGGHF